MNNRKLNTHLSQSDIALKIESLVQAIERSDTPAYRITHKRSGYERVEETSLSRYFTNVQQMYNLFDGRVPYDYSEHLLAFREACDDIGFFKQFELSIVATDERDAVRVRTNVRDEQAYLYRITLNQLDGAGLFRAFVEEANSLAQCPRFYHTISANCTTEVFHMMRRIIPGLPLDYRLLLSGYLPDYVQKVGGLQPGFSAEELRRRGRFTERALAADQAEDFSRQIRCGVPGWERE